MSAVNVAVIGAGRMAQVMSQVLLAGGGRVSVFSRRGMVRKALKEQLKKVHIVDSVEEACHHAHVVVLAVPAPDMPEAAASYAPFAQPDHIVIHACRGVAAGLVLPHQAIRNQTCVRKIVALGGPLYAEKLAKDRPMVAVAASRFADANERVRKLVEGTPVRLHGVSDVVGVEIAGAISNVSALAVGMSDALQLGDTARGVLLTRGLSEATRLGVRMGAELATFSGLAGVGDLIPRTVSSTKRHHDVGAQLSDGKTLAEALKSVTGSVEGVVTAQEVAAKTEKMGLRLPLVQGIAGILSGRLHVQQTLEDLLRLDLELEKESLAAGR